MSAPGASARVVFVCTGNTCRSPLAQALARALAAERELSVEVASAGVSAGDGAPANPDAVAAAAEAGLDLSQHRAQLLTRELVLNADLVLVMSASHARLARALIPEAQERVHVLGDYAEGRVGAGDVPDPIGLGIEVYRDTLRVLRGWVARSLERFFEGAESRER